MCTLINHLFHPFTHNNIHLTCKQKTAIALGTVLLPFLFIPSIVAYGIAYYLNKKKIHQLKQCSVVGSIGSKTLKTHSLKPYSPISTPKSATPSLVKDPLSEAYSEVKDAIDQLKHLKKDDKIAQYDLIEQAVRNKNVDWLEFIAFLDHNHSEAFTALFNVALLKKNKTSTTPYLKHMNMQFNKVKTLRTLIKNNKV